MGVKENEENNDSGEAKSNLFVVQSSLDASAEETFPQTAETDSVRLGLKALSVCPQ